MREHPRHVTPHRSESPINNCAISTKPISNMYSAHVLCGFPVVAIATRASVAVESDAPEAAEAAQHAGHAPRWPLALLLRLQADQRVQALLRPVLPVLLLAQHFVEIRQPDSVRAQVVNTAAENRASTDHSKSVK